MKLKTKLTCAGLTLALILMVSFVLAARDGGKKAAQNRLVVRPDGQITPLPPDPTTFRVVATLGSTNAAASSNRDTKSR